MTQFLFYVALNKHCTNFLWQITQLLSVKRTVKNTAGHNSKPKLNGRGEERTTYWKLWNCYFSAGKVTALYGTDWLSLSGSKAQSCSLGACWFVSSMAVCSPMANINRFSLSSFTIGAMRCASPHPPITSSSTLLQLTHLLSLAKTTFQFVQFVLSL